MRWELLEYRGYDSAGIACATRSGKQKSANVPEEVSDLRAICVGKLVSQCGIGHTRWATHGGVNDCNAHPHQVGKVTLVHNGIIENCEGTDCRITTWRIHWKSETDSEVVAALKPVL